MPPLAIKCVKPGEKHLYSAMVAGMDLMYFTDSWGSERKLLRTGLFYQRAFIFYHLFSAGHSDLLRYLEIRSRRMPAPIKKLLLGGGKAPSLTFIFTRFLTPANTGLYVKGSGI